MSGYYTKYPDNMQSRDELEIFHIPVQFGPPRSQLLLRLLLKLVSDSNCLENRSRILVILLFINLAARSVTTERAPSY